MIINTTPCGEDILTNHLAEPLCFFLLLFFPWVGLFLPPKQKSVAEVSWNWYTLGWLYNVDDKDCGSLTTDPATLERSGGVEAAWLAQNELSLNGQENNMVSNWNSKKFGSKNLAKTARPHLDQWFVGGDSRHLWQADVRPQKMFRIRFSNFPGEILSWAKLNEFLLGKQGRHLEFPWFFLHAIDWTGGWEKKSGEHQLMLVGYRSIS